MNSTMRKLAVLALLGMLSVAAAERSLLAHKPNSGTTLHGLAITGGSSGLEFTTNGNGTWGQLGSNTAFVAANSNPGATQATQTAALSSPATVGNAGLAYMPFGGITSVAFPSKSLGVAVSLGGYISAAGTAKTASIIISIDGVCSWLAVTNVPAYTIFTTSTTAPTPATPDLTTVWAASKSLIWAAGGTMPTATTALTATSLAALTGNVYTAGSPVIYQSTNGGTCWTALSLPAVAAGQSLGGILSIAADSHGKAVYAVGGPSTSTGGPALVASTTATSAAFYTSGGGGTSGAVNQGAISIAFSNAYGQNVSGAPSFQLQTAPVLPGYAYWLNGVTVLRSTIAFAVGGNAFGSAGSSLPGNTATAANNGIILGTFNGGFTWTQQVLPSTFTLSSSVGIIGAFANGTLPQLYAASNQLAKGSGSTTVWAVGALGFAVKAVVTPNSNSYSNSPFAPALTFTLVTGLGSKALYGITWDNANVGYAWGAGGIYATSNGGSTWMSQSPNSIITGSTPVLALATVPTTY